MALTIYNVVNHFQEEEGTDPTPTSVDYGALVISNNQTHLRGLKLVRYKTSEETDLAKLIETHGVTTIAILGFVNDYVAANVLDSTAIIPGVGVGAENDDNGDPIMTSFLVGGRFCEVEIHFADTVRVFATNIASDDCEELTVEHADPDMFGKLQKFLQDTIISFLNCEDDC